MPAKARNLFGGIASFPALLEAARKAAKGKRAKPGAAGFLANLEPEVLRLERELKQRQLSSGPLHRHRDTRAQTPPRLGCAFPRPGGPPRFLRGDRTHFRARFHPRQLRQPVGQGNPPGDCDVTNGSATATGWVLRCDIYRYFPAIDHEILKARPAPSNRL